MSAKQGADRPKPGRGRPTAFKPEFAKQAQKLAELGATDTDLAEFFGVTTVTIWRWSAKFPEFCKALKIGKGIGDDRVERSLYHKAVGYTFDSEKVFQYEGQIVRAKTVEHVPPSDTAAIFWLKNRRPEQWRDKQEVAHSGSVEHVHKISWEVSDPINGPDASA
jgi:hypothetical protein